MEPAPDHAVLVVNLRVNKGGQTIIFAGDGEVYTYDALILEFRFNRKNEDNRGWASTPGEKPEEIMFILPENLAVAMTKELLRELLPPEVEDETTDSEGV